MREGAGGLDGPMPMSFSSQVGYSIASSTASLAFLETVDCTVESFSVVSCGLYALIFIDRVWHDVLLQLRGA